MIIATGTLNIDENAKLAQKASKDAKKAADSASDEAGKIKTSLDGKITVSLQAPFNDGNDHEEGDIWYVQDEDHITSAMYTYDGSSWVKTKMSQTALSVGKLSALSADLGDIQAGYLNSVEIDSSTINSGYLNSVEIDSSTINSGHLNSAEIDSSTLKAATIKTGFLDSVNINSSSITAATIDATSTITGTSITGASIEEDSSNGRITLNKNGFCAKDGGHYLKFVSGNSNGYTQIRGSLDVDRINVGASYIEGQTFSAYGGNNTHIGSENAWTYLAEGIKCGPGGYISSVYGTDIYFHNEAGNTIDIHAGDVISHGVNLLSEINGKRDSSGDVNRIDGDIGNIRGDIGDLHGDVSRIDGDIERIRDEISNIKEELKHKKNK